MTPVDLHQQVAIVTGAGRGIGRAVSLALAQAGATVIACARTQSQLDSLAEAIQARGGSSLAWACDLAEEEQITGIFRRAHQEFGRLDILVNNAGIGLFGPLAEFATADFDRLVAVNLKATFLCCQQSLRLMMPAGRGYIINISSVVGFKGYVQQAGYTATKHGVMGLSKVLAAEAQPHGIRTSVILPGGVDTELVAAARPDLDRSILLQPDDIAAAVMYLLSLSDRAAIDEIYIRRRNSQPW